MLVTMMLEGFPASSARITDATIEAYAIALHGIEIESVKLACGRMIRGDVERFNANAAPSAAELTQEARRIASERAHARWLDQQKLLPAPPEPVVDEAMRKRIGVKLVALADSLSVTSSSQKAKEADARRNRMVTATDRFLALDERPIAERLRFDDLGLKTGT